MPPSMRRQCLEFKIKQERDAQRQTSRAKVADVLRSDPNTSADELCEQTGIPRATFYRIKRAMRAEDNEGLARLLSPADNRAGKTRVLTDEEETMIYNRIIFAATCGFAADSLDLKGLMSRIAADGRANYYQGFPSNDVIRSFRARNRNITYRSSENKDVVKLKGESYHHVKTYADVLKRVDNDFPGMLQDADKIWNMDETAVSAEFGRKFKAFVSSNTHHGGSLL